MEKLKIGVVPVTAFQQNCALFWHEDSMEGVVFDPGGDAERIIAAIDQTGVKVQQVLLTHGHLDHVGAAMAVKEHFGGELVGPHKDDRDACERAESVATSYGLQGINNAYPDRWLEEGDTVSVAGYDFDVLHCPGHSPGHVVFHSPQLKFAHVGDVLFRGSVGRTDLPGGNHDDLIASIKDKLLPLGDDVSFVCGHGPGSTFGQERLTNPFLQ